MTKNKVRNVLQGAEAVEALRGRLAYEWGQVWRAEETAAAVVEVAEEEELAWRGA